MPISGRDITDITEKLRENWRLENGQYIVSVQDVNRIEVSPDEQGKPRKPIKWDLVLENSDRVLEKVHWIDKEGGVNILVSDLFNLGLNVTPDNAVTACNSLIGTKILIYFEFDQEHGRYNITFIRQI